MISVIIIVAVIILTYSMTKCKPATNEKKLTKAELLSYYFYNKRWYAPCKRCNSPHCKWAIRLNNPINVSEEELADYRNKMKLLGAKEFLIKDGEL